MTQILTEFPYVVIYGRHGVINRRSFPTLEELAGWVERSEEREEIWAAAVEHDGVVLFNHEHPPSEKRWIQETDVPWPGKHP